MEVFKCPICGGDIEVIENQNIGQCIYCGNKVAVPSVSAQKLQLYNNASQLRQKCEFTRARSIYEHILLDDSNEADAYWGIVLCKYGIEYVDDPKTGEKIPTCHRAAATSIYEDDDYKKAIANGDDDKKQLWQAEAQRIDRLLKEILAEAGKQNDFDIFICYKESDEEGRRTRDSVIAWEIYNALTKEGYKVFFAPKSIGLGKSYEPVIFAALHSAKLMFVIGTQGSYLEAPWVKNEWSRYLELIYAGEAKTLIVLYKDIQPALDFPTELMRLQAYNLDTMGYIQDISDAAQKIVGKRQTRAKASSAERTVSLRYVSQGDAAAAQKQWTEAAAFYSKAASVDKTCAAAWWGKLRALTSDFEICDKEPVYTPEEVECKNAALRYADRDAHETYTNILENYERSISRRVTEKYRTMLNQMYDEETANLSDQTYLQNIDDHILETTLSGYERIFDQLSQAAYQDEKPAVRSEQEAFKKYRGVFNGLLKKYSLSGRKNDADLQKQSELKTQIQAEQTKADGYRGILVSVVLCIVSLAVSLFGIIDTLHESEMRVFAVSFIIAVVCLDADIVGVWMYRRSGVVRFVIALIFPIILMIAGVFAGITLTEIFGMDLSGSSEFFWISVLLACISAVDLLLRLIKFQKGRQLKEKISKLMQQYEQTKASMISQTDAQLDEAEQECSAAKTYFLKRQYIYQLIRSL